MPSRYRIKIFFLFSGISLIGLCNLHAQQNSFRLGVFGLAYGRVNVTYERALGNNKSINIQAGVQTPRKFPILISLLDPPCDFSIDSGKWRASGISTDLRFYSSRKKQSPKGFYLAPFLSYNYNKLYLIGTHCLDNTADQNTLVNTYKVHAHNVSVGAKIGCHWVLNEHLSVDLTYFGLGFGAMATNTIFKSENSSKNYQQLALELEDEIRWDGTYLGNYRAEPKSDHVKLTSFFFVPAIRFSCSMGYTF